MLSEKKKDVSVWADSFNAIGSMVVFPIIIGTCIYLLIDFCRTGQMDVFWFFLAMAVPTSIGCILFTSKTMVRFTFTEDGVIHKAPFKKTEFVPYKAYPYVYRASYWHGPEGIAGKRRAFAVMTNRFTKDSELMRVNAIPCSKTFLKIRLTERNVQALKAVLPHEKYSQFALILEQSEERGWCD